MISHRGQTGETAQPLLLSLHKLYPSFGKEEHKGRTGGKKGPFFSQLPGRCSRVSLAASSPSVFLFYIFLLLTAADYGGGTPGSRLYFSLVILLRIGVLNTIPMRMTPRVSS